MNSRFISLKGTKNTRDLGGYKTLDGKTTKYKVFLRSDNTDKLTSDDIKILKNKYNVSTVIDLRNEFEIKSCKDKLSEAEGIKYFSFPITISIQNMKNLIENKTTLSDAYFDLINKKSIIKKLFKIIENSKDGAILFHCVHGKDRTGALSMILLGLANVSKEDIVKDYEKTFELIKNEKYVKNGIEKNGLSLYQSLREYIEPVIDYIEQTFKTFEKYLIWCGVNNETISLVKSKFV
ncbi:MAG: tyrosine-protein phosphatase [Oscillospiraceae bacterium]|jgi:protein-tyrosine phosphatase|nr:tyrosine-protein phosphatase [Oscillospiraceae bacterium]